MIDTRSDTSDHSFETKGAFLAPSLPEQDVAWLDQKEKEVRASVTESFPNGHSMSEEVDPANLAQKGSIVIGLANRKTESFSDRKPIEVYLAELPIGQEILKNRKEKLHAA